SWRRRGGPCGGRGGPRGRGAPAVGMRRWARRAALALAALVVLLAVPVVWIEGRCTAPRAAPSAIRVAPLVDEPGYARRESDSYLSFPEWSIVYAYDDLAGVLARGDESDFGYGRWIRAF